uniref:RNA-directed DNA polymerase (Reverse transcriptase) domain containing protein n=1 Tax=Haemonchus contortus TaxID=6289 RepID=A0A7I4YV49_HAECO
MEVKVGDRCIHHLRFADHIVLITANIKQAGRLFAAFDNACGRIGLQLTNYYITKTMFMRNGMVPDAPFTLNGLSPNALGEPERMLCMMPIGLRRWVTDWIPLDIKRTPRRPP